MGLPGWLLIWEPIEPWHGIDSKQRIWWNKIIEKVHPRKLYETLGVFIAPGGSQMKQSQEMTKKATLWVDKIRTGHLPAQ